MTLIPDVPLAIVVVHLAALGAMVTQSLVVNLKRLALIRQTRQDEL